MGILDRLRASGSETGAPSSVVPDAEHQPSAAPAPSVPVVLSDSAFLAIDFETATEQRASACAVGFALFEDGALRDTGATLIDPGIDPTAWNPFNRMVHGIDPSDVVGAPSFADVWSELERRFAGAPLVAHNAAFDMSVLRSELARAGAKPVAPIRYTCSASVSRAAWPELLSVSLPVVAEQLDIELDHHEPGSDARASGEILLRAADALGAADIDDALQKAHRVWGQIDPDLTWVSGWLGTPLRAKDFSPNNEDVDPEHPLYGQTVVFTGTLHSMTRREAFAAVSHIGAAPGDGVTKHTNILVVGEQDIARLAAGESMSGKQRKAADLRVKGQDIQLVGEMDFLRML